MTNFNKLRVTGTIYDITEDSTSLYVCGSQLQAEPISEGHPFNRRISPTTGNSIDSILQVNGGISGSTIHNNSLYIWGSFTEVNGIARNLVAKLNAITFELDENFNAPTYTLPGYSYRTQFHIDDDYLYLVTGGPSFGYQQIIKLSLTNGLKDNNFGAFFNDSAIIYAITGDETSLYIGGSKSWDYKFTHTTEIGGTASTDISQLIKISKDTGDLDSTFNHTFDYDDIVYDLKKSSSELYVAGYFNGGLKVLNTTSGSVIRTVTGLTLLHGMVNGRPSVQNIEFDNSNNVFLYGDFDRFGDNVDITNLIKLNRDDLTLDSTFVCPDIIGYNNIGSVYVQKMVFTTNNDLYIAGQFYAVNQHDTKNIVKLNSLTGEVDTTFKNAGNAGSVAGLITFNDSSLFIYGTFHIHNNPEKNLIKISKDTGLEDTLFNINVDFDIQYYTTTSSYFSINKMYVHENDLYVYGNFEKIDNITLNRFARVNKNTGTLDSSFQPFTYNSEINVNVYDILIDVIDNVKKLYVLRYSSTNGQSTTRYFVELNINTGEYENSFDFTHNNSLTRIQVDGDYLYLSGDVTTFNSAASVNRLIKLNKRTGVLDSTFNVPFTINNLIVDMIVTEDSIYIAGRFYTVDVAQKIAKLDKITGQVDSTFLTQFPSSPTSGSFRLAIDSLRGYLYSLSTNTINSVKYLHRFLLTTGSLTTFELHASTFLNSSSVFDMLLSDNKVYVGGVWNDRFSGKFVALSSTTGELALSGLDDIVLTPNTINENSSSGSIIGTLSAVSGTSPIAWELISGAGDTDNSSFDIDGNNVILLSNVLLDYESKNVYSIRIKALDSDNYTFEKSLNINVLNVNETPTSISLSNLDIQENQPINTIVGTLSGIDPDNDNLTFSITDGSHLFNIFETNKLRTSVVFDHELNQSNQITIVATDSQGLTYSQSFTINVTDTNEPPTNITLSSNTIIENNEINQTIGTLTASDPELDAVTFSIVSGSEKFNIASNTLQASTVFDYEIATSHDVTIRATDSQGATFDKTFTILVQNQDEAPENILLSNASLQENNTIGHVIGTLSVVDTEVDTVIYTLVSGYGDNASFSIEGDSLKAAVVFNYELKNSYSIKVAATDVSNNVTEKIFQISVTNVNEGPVDIRLSGTNLVENNEINQLVGTLTSNDPEGGTVSYSLVSGGDKFNLSVNNGITQLKTSVVFDYDEAISHTIVVRATNSLNISTDASFTVNILPFIEEELIDLGQDSFVSLDNGLVYAELAYDPQLYVVRANGTPLQAGAVVINTNTKQKYVKLSGDAKRYYKIPLNAKTDWNWSDEGNEIWLLL